MQENMEHKRLNAMQYLEERGLLAASRSSKLVYTNSVGTTIEPPSWLKPKQATNNIVGIYKGKSSPAG